MGGKVTPPGPRTAGYQGGPGRSGLVSGKTGLSASDTFIPLYILVFLPGVVDIPRDPKKGSDAADPNAVDETGAPIIRVRLPKRWAREQFAIAELMMGANHIRVRCMDGVTRMGRIKGKIKKRAWIREGDTLIVVPWSFQDEKCDIIYRYLPPQTDWLRRNRYI